MYCSAIMPRISACRQAIVQPASISRMFDPKLQAWQVARPFAVVILDL